MTIYEYDYGNDGTIDSAWYYTYDANGNMTNEEFDSGNDGTIDMARYFTYE
jgi:hypothetical protein